MIDAILFTSMSDKEQKKIRTEIVKALKQKDDYEKDSDDILINELLFNLEMVSAAKDDIRLRGTIQDIGKDKPYYQVNNSISVYHSATDKILRILKQLGFKKEVKDTDGKETALDSLSKLLK